MTTREATSKRWNINLNLDRLDILVLGVLIGLFLAAVGMSLYFHFRTALPDLADWLDSVLQNTGTEMFGAFLTFALIEVMLRKRREQDAERRAIVQEKQRLVLQMGSPDNAFAVEAARILKARGWGYDDDTTLHEASLWRANLQGADLGRANLQGASLFGANLQGAYLSQAKLQGANLAGANLQGIRLARADMREANLAGANLQGTRLAGANLQGASLVGADLRGADLIGANLQGANLPGVNLQGANLVEVNLQGVKLVEANLQGATLESARYDVETTLPDDSKWTPDTDMAHFTDPEHPDFWRSNNPVSPAYRGKESDD